MADLVRNVVVMNYSVYIIALLLFFRLNVGCGRWSLCRKMTIWGWFGLLYDRSVLRWKRRDVIGDRAIIMGSRIELVRLHRRNRRILKKAWSWATRIKSNLDRIWGVLAGVIRDRTKKARSWTGTVRIWTKGALRQAEVIRNKPHI